MIEYMKTISRNMQSKISINIQKNEHKYATANVHKYGFGHMIQICINMLWKCMNKHFAIFAEICKSINMHKCAIWNMQITQNMQKYSSQQSMSPLHIQATICKNIMILYMQNMQSWHVEINMLLHCCKMCKHTLPYLHFAYIRAWFTIKEHCLNCRPTRLAGCAYLQRRTSGLPKHSSVPALQPTAGAELQITLSLLGQPECRLIGIAILIGRWQVNLKVKFCIQNSWTQVWL